MSKKLTWQERMTELIRDCTPTEASDRAQFALALAKVRLPPTQKKERAKTRVGKAAKEANQGVS